MIGSLRETSLRLLFCGGFSFFERESLPLGESAEHSKADEGNQAAFSALVPLLRARHPLQSPVCALVPASPRGKPLLSEDGPLSVTLFMEDLPPADSVIQNRFAIPEGKALGAVTMVGTVGEAGTFLFRPCGPPSPEGKALCSEDWYLPPIPSGPRGCNEYRPACARIVNGHCP